MKKVIFPVLLLSLFVFISCRKHTDEPAQLIFKGTETTIGAGKAWSWVEMAPNHNPQSVGISFSKSAFTNLPGNDVNNHMEYSYSLSLPAEKSITPFDHIVIDWNPHGHPPAMVYDKPHFDLHYYMISEAERLRIPDYDADSTGFLNFPGPGYLPTTYFPIPGGEEKMGTHWVDGTSPELSMTNPQLFTQTFIYGSYNGKVAFYEPMATLNFLTSTTSYIRDIPQPAKFGKDGYYPTRISFTDKGSTMDIRLYDFVHHTKS